MQAIGSDQQRAIGFGAAAVARLDQRCDSVLLLAVTGHPMTQPQRIGAETIAYSSG